ncbi:MAG: RCC1 domain-containing protein [Pseudomonadota bacterium]
MRTWCCFLVLLGLGLMRHATAAPQVDGGEGFTCALGSSGRAFCWGTNTSSQTGSGLGLPVLATVSRPTEMAAGFVTVSSSAWQSCGL